MKATTEQEFAQRLNGREYGSEITESEEAEAKTKRLVVVFGYSDDNMELRGAVHDEVGCYDGGDFKVTAKGVLPEWEEHEEKNKRDAMEWFALSQEPFAEVKAQWGNNSGYSWWFETNAPHATFDIMEDGDKFCRGIVFSLNDLPA